VRVALGAENYVERDRTNNGPGEAPAGPSEKLPARNSGFRAIGKEKCFSLPNHLTLATCLGMSVSRVDFSGLAIVD